MNKDYILNTKWGKVTACHFYDEYQGGDCYKCYDEEGAYMGTAYLCTNEEELKNFIETELE